MKKIFKTILACRECGVYQSVDFYTHEMAKAARAQFSAEHVLEQGCDKHTSYIEPRLAGAPEVV